MNKSTEKTVRVNLGARSYAIRIGQSALERWSLEFALRVDPSAFCLVTDDIIQKNLKKCIRKLAFQQRLHNYRIPAGERSKNLRIWENILRFLLRKRLDRKAVLIAFGGGVVGDIAGFAASAYRRGIAYVQVPTTLLAMVDSSVGGKTAVNHPLGKNMIGAFWQPAEVWIDLDVLATLPEREFRAGLAEVIKYAFIGGREFFEWTRTQIGALLSRDSEALIECIERCCRFKAKIVEQDERETGLRAILNYGHTFGHAIEACAGYGKLVHGEAVNYGIRAAAELGRILGNIDAEYAEEQQRLCSLLEPHALPPLKIRDLMESMLHDKKVQNASVRLVLSSGVGEVELACGIRGDKIKKAWNSVL